MGISCGGDDEYGDDDNADNDLDGCDGVMM